MEKLSKKIKKLEARIFELIAELNRPISGMEAAAVKAEISELKIALESTRHRDRVSRLSAAAPDLCDILELHYKFQIALDEAYCHGGRDEVSRVYHEWRPRLYKINSMTESVLSKINGDIIR